MPKNIKTLLKSFLILGLFALSIQALAIWTGPTATAPGANATPPINTGTTPQIKTGDFQAMNIVANNLVSFGQVMFKNTITGVLQPLTVGAITSDNKIETTGLVKAGTMETGTIKITGGTAPLTDKVLTSDVDGNATWKTPSASTGTGLPPSTAGFTLRNTGTTNWTADGAIFNNGINVGIGTTTPGAKLDVNGPVRIKTTAAPFGIGLKVVGDSINSSTSIWTGRADSEMGLGVIAVAGSGSTFATIGDAVLLTMSEDLILTTRSLTGAIRFGTNLAPNNNDTEKMTISNSGNVGIGTPTPGQKLTISDGSIKGEAKLDGTGTIHPAFKITPFSNSGWDAGVTIGTASNWGEVYRDEFTIRKGNVGIGTTTPGAKLEIKDGGNTHLILNNPNVGGESLFFHVGGAQIISKNGFYDGSWKYDKNGPIQHLLFDDGNNPPKLRFAPAGTAGATATDWKEFKMGAGSDGNFYAVYAP